MFSFTYKNTIDFAHAETFFDAPAEHTAELMADFMLDRARYWCPVDTGFLRQSIVKVKGNGPNGYYFYVVATAPYAQYVEFGYHVSRFRTDIGGFKKGQFAPQEAHRGFTKADATFGLTRKPRDQYANVLGSNAANKPGHTRPGATGAGFHPPNPFMRKALAETRAAFPELARRAWMEAAANPSQLPLQKAGFADIAPEEGFGSLGVQIG